MKDTYDVFFLEHFIVESMLKHVDPARIGAIVRHFTFATIPASRTNQSRRYTASGRSLPRRDATI